MKKLAQILKGIIATTEESNKRIVESPIKYVILVNKRLVSWPDAVRKYSRNRTLVDKVFSEEPAALNVNIGDEALAMKLIRYQINMNDSLIRADDLWIFFV